MPPSQNRRVHNRWKLEKDIFCYVDGVRLDARCENISTGGLFIRTSHHKSLPIGALVGLTFRMREGSGIATFLFGRIVRRVKGSKGGVGLSWEKAVTVGPREEMAGFLKKVFRIEDADIQEEPSGKRQVRSIFHFPPQGASKLIPIRTGPPAAPAPEPLSPVEIPPLEPVEPAPVPDEPAPIPEAPAQEPPDRVPEPPKPVARAAAEPPVVKPVQASPEEAAPARRSSGSAPVDGITAGDGPAEKPPSAGKTREPSSRFEASAELPHSKQPGAISQMIARTHQQASVDINAELVAHDVDVRAKILSLGNDGMILECPFVLIDEKSIITVRFNISSKGSSIPIECSCKLNRSLDGHAPGSLCLDLKISGNDEGGHPGVLSRYVKWLLFHSLANA